MRIGIVGAGIAGLTAAYRLHANCEVTVFEAGDYVGGHTNTVYPEIHGQSYAVDTGFIVFNELRYPKFVTLLRELDVPWRTSNMSFSVSNEQTGLEYVASSEIARFFAQPRNLVRPKFWYLLREIVRFRALAQQGAVGTYGPDETVAEFAARNRFSQAFLDDFLHPMAGAIWSLPFSRVRDFPIKSLVQFYNHHRFLDVRGQPDWLTIQGGSQQYVQALTRKFLTRIRTNTPVAGVTRAETGVSLRLRDGSVQHFDKVVLACHSDQALAILEDPSDAEQEILGAIPYQKNRAVLHTDISLLPKTRRAWASWNVRVPKHHRHGAIHVTYNMNRLQGIQAPVTFCVTLNGGNDIDPNKILYTKDYSHPIFTTAGRLAQAHCQDISGHRNTHYAGAYWTYGFHEDGVNSGLRVADELM